MRKFLLYLYIVLVGISATCFFTQNIFAEQRNTITFSSGYLERFYNNKQVANFGIEFLENANFVLEKLNATVMDEFDNKFVRLVSYYTLGFLDVQFIFTFLVSYHEFGHSMRSNALGFDNIFIKTRKKFTEGTSNFFVYFLNGIFSTTFENLSSACVHISDKIEDEENLVLFSGGLNNQIYFQEKVFDDLMYKYNKISYSYFAYSIISNSIYYYENIIPTKKGSNGDIGRVLESFENLGVNVTKEDFKKVIITSILFSQFTYSSLYYNLFAKDNFITPFQYKNFIFPDVFPYITTKGLSYRIKSAYRYSDDLIFRFGVEFVAYGKSAQEFIFGINTKFIKNTRLDLMTTFGKYGFNLETTYTVPLSEHFNINFDFDIYSTKSLYGERNAYRLYKVLSYGYKINHSSGEYTHYEEKESISYSCYFGLSISYIF